MTSPPPPERFDTPDTIRQWTGEQHRQRRTVGLVPTMGALHDGHLSLIDVARARTDLVVVSIFVNPMQFNRTDDFDAYPRPLDDDLDRCRERGVDAVYVPIVGVLYPDGFQTTVTPGALAETMEGAMRPGHFQGVATVVTKLFGAVQPDVAVFGEKDFQQLIVIRRLVRDLDLGVEIVAGPIVREPDGLALSSRNRRLPASDRTAAVCVPGALDAAIGTFADGQRSPRTLEAAAAAVVDAEPAAQLEYVTVFDPETLAPLGEDAPADARTRIAIAVWFGDVRLIDNRQLGDSQVV